MFKSGDKVVVVKSAFGFGRDSNLIGKTGFVIKESINKGWDWEVKLEDEVYKGDDRLWDFQENELELVQE